MTARRTDLCAAGALLLATLVLYGPAVGGGDFFARDVHAYWYPQIATFVRVVSQGGPPLWDPYEGFGLPLLADPGSQALYPPQWLNLVLLPGLCYTLFVIGHTVFAGYGTYRLGRAWGLRPLPAWVAGVGWAASGPLVSAAGLYHHFMSAAWMPWVLLGVERLWQHGRPRQAALLALAAALQVLAGSGDLCVMTAVACAARVAQLAVGPEGEAVRARRLRTLALAAVGAALLAAAQWLPTLDAVRGTARASLEPALRVAWSVHPASLFQLLVPHALADLPLTDAVRARLLESREPFLPSLYWGAALSALAALGVGRRGSRLLCAVLVALFVALSLGRYLPPAAALLGLPPFSMFRYPVKYMLPAALFWSLLAGHGLDRLSRGEPSSSRVRALSAAVAVLGLVLGGLALSLRLRPLLARRWLNPPDEWLASAVAPLVASLALAALAALASAALLAVAAGRPSRPWVPAALAAVAAADVIAAGIGLNPVAPPELMRHRPPLLARIGTPPPADARVYVPEVSAATLNRSLVRGPAGWRMDWSYALGLQEQMQAPVGARWGLFGSYDADYTGLAPRDLPRVSAFVRSAWGTPAAVRMLRVGGVGWTVSFDAPAVGLLPVAEQPSVFRQPLELARVPDPLPLVSIVGGVRGRGDVPAELVLASASFDPAGEVLLEGAAGQQPAPPDFHGRVRVLSRRADLWTLEVESSADAHVLVLDAFMPGWRARLDGAAAPVLLADGLFKAVPVPAGTHRLVLRYLPRSVVAGALLSAAGLLLVAGAFVADRRSALPRAGRAG